MVNAHTIHHMWWIHTRCHLLLIALESFATPPDTFSLPDSAATQAVHATSFGLLSPHCVSSLAFFKARTRVPLSSQDHVVVLSLPTAVLPVELLAIGKVGE